MYPIARVTIVTYLFSVFCISIIMIKSLMVPFSANQQTSVFFPIILTIFFHRSWIYDFPIVFHAIVMMSYQHDLMTHILLEHDGVVLGQSPGRTNKSYI